jgi:hypothetical protein
VALEMFNGNLYIMTTDNTQCAIYKLKTEKPSIKIKCIRHALSLSEERKSFEPFLYDERDHPDTESRIYCGEHSNIGGGLSRNGLNSIPLRWIIEESENKDLIYSEHAKEEIFGSSNHFDEIFNSRKGLKIFFGQKVRNFQKWFAKYNIIPKIDRTVFLRIYANLYAPDNLPENGVVADNNKVYLIDLKKLTKRLQPIYLAQKIAYWGFVIFSCLSVYSVLTISSKKIGWVQTFFSIFSFDIIQTILSLLKNPEFLIGLVLFYIANEVIGAVRKNTCSKFWSTQNKNIKEILHN